MSKKQIQDKFILMVVYNQIQYDARVIRSAKALSDLGENVVIISSNSDEHYKNKYFQSVVFKSSLNGPLLLFSFWFYVIKFCLKHKQKISLLYMHDYYLPFLGLVLSKMLKLKWIYDAHELLVDHRRNIIGKRAWFFMLLEKYSITNANLVVSANEERARIVKFIYKLKNAIFVLNISSKPKLEKKKTSKEDIIVYQGALSEERNISTLISMLEHLPNRVKLKLIGDGPDTLIYKNMVDEMKLRDRVIFTGKIAYSKLLEESRNCKIGIVVYKLEGLNTYYCSPNKIYEYAQLNIPMLMSSQPFLKSIVDKYNIGDIIYPNDTIMEIAQKTLKVIDNFDSYTINMNDFLSDYSYEKEMDKLKYSISKLLVQN